MGAELMMLRRYGNVLQYDRLPTRYFEYSVCDAGTAPDLTRALEVALRRTSELSGAKQPIALGRIEATANRGTKRPLELTQQR